jgi:6-phosphogluconolactonase
LTLPQGREEMPIPFIPAVLPRFAFTANLSDNTISQYTFDDSNSRLRPSGYIRTGSEPIALAIAQFDDLQFFLYCTNYAGGTVSAYAVDGASGRFAEIAGSPFAAGTHPFAVTVLGSQSPLWLLVANLDSNTISVFGIDENTGVLTPAPGSPVLAAKGPAAIVQGSYVCVPAYYAGEVNTFSFNQQTGHLTLAAGGIKAGTNPIAACVFEQFLYVANQGSNNISAYVVNPQNGSLTPVAKSPFPAGQQPVALCAIAFGSSNGMLFAANEKSNDVSSFRIDPSSGALSHLSGSPSPAGRSPTWIRADDTIISVTSKVDNSLRRYTVNQTTGALAVQQVMRTRQAPENVAVSYEFRGALRPTFAYVSNGSIANTISAYSAHLGTGALSEIAGSPFATSAVPGQVAVDPSGRFVIVANESLNTQNPTPGSVSAYVADLKSGALSPAPGSPSAVNFEVGNVVIDPSGRFVYTGNHNANITNGSIAAFSINSTTGALQAIAGSPFDVGAYFPIGLTADPTGQFLFASLRNSSTTFQNAIGAYSINPATGALTPVAGSPFPYSGLSLHWIAVEPGGRFVCATNDGPGVEAYNIDPTSGALTLIGAVFIPNSTPPDGPLSFGFDPYGRYCYVGVTGGPTPFSPTITVFAIDPASGSVSQIGSPTLLKVSEVALDLQVDASGSHLYAATSGPASQTAIRAYKINASTGQISEISGSPFALSKGNRSIAISG